MKVQNIRSKYYFECTSKIHSIYLTAHVALATFSSFPELQFVALDKTSKVFFA